MTRLRTSGRPADEGSILPLIAGYGALALVVVLLVTAANSLYIERKRLFSLADGAALVGAESFELSAVRPGAGPGRASKGGTKRRSAITERAERRLPERPQRAQQAPR